MSKFSCSRGERARERKRERERERERGRKRERERERERGRKRERVEKERVGKDQRALAGGPKSSPHPHRSVIAGWVCRREKEGKNIAIGGGREKRERRSYA